MKLAWAVLVLAGGTLVLARMNSFAAAASGPLRPSEANGRYFADSLGRIVYLTGSHTWNNFQDMGTTDPPPALDFDGYLRFLQDHHHNFIRLWRWELVSWNTEANHEKEPRIHFCSPHPWPRTGSEKALDGKPKFDLERFNEEYFERLRARVAAAGQRGIYVSIMLFEGWGLQFVPEGWKAHPFNSANNRNGVDGDAFRDGKGLAIYTLTNPAITRLQEAYARKVIDTVNDQDNVLYEISNENFPPSTEWQDHFIRFIHDYEKSKAKQHPVGMTFQYKGGDNATLMASPAEWVSPNPQDKNDFDYRTNPPPAEARKVILSDTDHLWGIGGDTRWVWKTFMRGMNPLFMDPYKDEILQRGSPNQWEPLRLALGESRRYAERVDLRAMTPHPELASTGFCLANPGEEYLIYQPQPGKSFVATLYPGKYTFEWLNASSSVRAVTGQAQVSESQRQLRAPFVGEAVLYLKIMR